MGDQGSKIRRDSQPLDLWVPRWAGRPRPYWNNWP